jgi:hypothetical protein
MRLPLLTSQFFLAVQEAIAGTTPGLGVAYTPSEWRWAMAIADRLAARNPNWAIYTPSHWSLAVAVADRVSGSNSSWVLYSPLEQVLAEAIAPYVGPPIPRGITPLLAATSSLASSLIGAIAVTATTALLAASAALGSVPVASSTPITVASASTVTSNASLQVQGSTAIASATASTGIGGQATQGSVVTSQIYGAASTGIGAASIAQPVGTAIANSTASTGVGVSGGAYTGATPQLSASASTGATTATQVSTGSTAIASGTASTGTGTATQVSTSGTASAIASASTAAGTAMQLSVSNTPTASGTASTGTGTATQLLAGSTPNAIASASTVTSTATQISASSTALASGTASTGTRVAAIAVSGTTLTAAATASTGTGTNQDAAVSIYQNNVAIAGGTVTAATLGYLDTFVKGCKTDGTWTALVDVGVFCGSNLASALVKLKFPSGYPSSFINANFIETDYSQSTGLNPGGTNTKYLDTGVPPSATTGTQSFHLSFYSRTTSSGAMAELGTTNGTVFAGLYCAYSQTMVLHTYFDAFNQEPAGELDVLVSSSLGFFVGSRISATNFYAARNGSSLGSAATSAGSKPTTNMGIFTYLDGSGAGLTNRICAYYSMGTGLTTAQTTSYYNRVQALQTSLGRQV